MAHPNDNKRQPQTSPAAAPGVAKPAETAPETKIEVEVQPTVDPRDEEIRRLRAQLDRIHHIPSPEEREEEERRLLEHEPTPSEAAEFKHFLERSPWARKIAQQVASGSGKSAPIRGRGAAEPEEVVVEALPSGEADKPVSVVPRMTINIRIGPAQLSLLKGKRMTVTMGQREWLLEKGLC